MPLINPYGVGGLAAARGKTTLTGIMAAAADDTTQSRALLIENLPIIQLRLTQTSNQGVGLGATVNLQYMIRDGTLAAQKWTTYTTFAMPAGGVVITPFGLLGLTLPASQIRLQMTAAAAAVGDTTVDFDILVTA